MTSLLLDTSTPYVTLAIIKENEVCYLFHERLFETLSVKMLPLIDEALKFCSLKINDINRIYVATGPGSFTGIRIGLTIMKVIAWSLNIDIVPISSLELMASTNQNVDYIIPYIDARHGNCFIGIYDNDLNPIIGDKFTNFRMFIEKIETNKTYKIISNDVLEYENVVEPSINILKVINKHKNDNPVNPHLVNPNYLKLTEAEEKLKIKND